jgi:Ice-binding-like
MATLDSLLLTASNFDVLGASTVTNSGNTVIQGGNLGLFPGTAVTGFPPGVLIPPAVKHVTDSVAQQAQLDALAAYTHFQTLPSGTVESQLAGLTLAPGTYTSASSLDLSVGGTLTLDGQGNSNAQFIFQVGSALTINVGATVKLINGAVAANVVWQVGSSATVNTSAVMVGDIIAQASVSMGTGASLTGRAIALTGAVTLLGNSMFSPSSAGPPFPPAPPATFSSNAATITLSEICHPDITGKILRSWGLVTISNGGYTTGGIPMGLFNFLDVRTVDVQAILRADVYGEDPYSAVILPGYTYHYSPVNDSLQIFYAGAELLSLQTIPAGVMTNVLLFVSHVDRTSTKG